MKKTIESVSTATPIGKRSKPTVVEINVVPMLAESAFGSATPELPSVLNALVIPKMVPSKPKSGDSISSEPTTIPAISILRFAFMFA